MFAVVLLALLISVPVRAELRDPNNSADYIILTNQEVLSNNAWIDSLLDYRTAQGRVSMAVTVEQIWDEFEPFGSDTAIRDFLHYAYDNWQAPRLKDVFIVGHWDVVPTGSYVGIVDSVAFASDYLFAVNPNGDDALPRFRVGRLPWSPRYEVPLNSYYSKVRTYESSLGGDWLNRCHLFADSGSAWPNQYEDWSEGVASRVPEEIARVRDYLSRPQGDDWHGDPEEVIENMRAGALLTCYGGVSNGYRYFSAEPITPAHLGELDNLQHLTVLTGSVTHSLGQDSSDELPLYLAALNSLNGGAIAALGVSSIPWYIASQVYNRQFVKEIFSAESNSIGDAWHACCTFTYDTVMYGHLNPSSAADQLFGTFLLGDPATIIPGRITSADPIVSPVVPSTVEIVGNYPNPFNPSTTINFMLNRAGSARLTVYDITGRAVTTLAEQSFTAGSHSIVWNAAGHASGIYLVRLESGGQFDTHKITLLK